MLAALVVTVTAYGCTDPPPRAGADSKETPTPKETPGREQAADGNEIGPEGPSPEFTVVLPRGWKKAPAEAEQVYQRPPDLILAGETTDDFASNISFFKTDDAGTLPLERYPELVMTDLAEDPGPDPELEGTPEPLEVAGEEALSFDYELQSQGAPYMVRQVLFYRGEDLWFTTFAAAPAAFDDELTDLESILESWSWRA